MNEPLDDATFECLCAWLDGELDGPQHAAERERLERLVADSPSARDELEALRALRSAASDLGQLEPPRTVWAGVRAGLQDGGASEGVRAAGPGPRVPRAPLAQWWITAVAAGLCFLLGSLFGGRGGCAGPGPAGEGPQVADLPRWLLILHEPEGLMAGATPEEVRAVVAEYAGWAGDLARAGSLEAAEKLVDGEGFVLHPDGRLEDRARLDPGAGPDSSVGGYFQVRAANEAAALELTRGCPHLRQGGWVELRRIQELDS